MTMETKETLENILKDMPEDSVQQVLDFARFLAARQEALNWSHFARAQLDKLYGPDGPTYTLDDIKPELTS